MTKYVASCAVMVVLLGACGDKGAAPDASVIDAAQGGSITFSWKIAYQTAPLTCADVGAVTVTIVATPDAGGFAKVESVGCSGGDASATIVGVPAGSHDISITLTASGSRQLGGEVTFENQIVTEGQITDLGEVAFEVEPKGSFTFTMYTGDVDGNCAGGTDLQQVLLELRDGAGACENADAGGAGTTFSIGASTAGQGGVAQTYVRNCGDQVAFNGCIFSDQVITVSDIVSGPHQLYIGGFIAAQADACFVELTPFTVVGSNYTTALNPQHLDTCLDVDAG